MKFDSRVDMRRADRGNRSSILTRAHIFLLFQPGTLNAIGTAADELSRTPTYRAAYVPQVAQILFSTKLVDRRYLTSS